MASTIEQELEDTRAIRSERLRILSAMLDDLHSLADAGARTIRSEIASYTDAAPRLLSDMREQVELHYRTKLTALLAERSATLEDLSFVRGAAIRRARAGFALEDYVTAFRVGQQVFWDALLEQAGSSHVAHEAALSLAGPVMRYVDMASTHAAHAYAEFQQHALATDDGERRDLLERLLAGEMPTRGRLLAVAQAHGLRPDARLMVLTAMHADARSDMDALRLAGAAISRSGLRGAKTLVVIRHSELVAVPVLPPDVDPLQMCACIEEVQAGLAREGLALAIGISTIADGLHELPRAYSEACAALECVAGGAGVGALPRLSPFQYLALQAGDTARRLIDPEVRRFLEEDRARGGTLRETLRAFAAADLNVRVLAERLHLHPNTAHYRLRRIEERSGRNPRHIEDLLELLLAIAIEP